MNEPPKNEPHNEAGTSADTVSSHRAVKIRNGKIDSAELFGSTRQLVILHGEDTYTLRITAQNKLILTK